MAAEGVAAEKDHVQGQDDGAKPDAKVLVAGVAVEKPHRTVGVAGENDQKNQRDVEEVSMDVLKHERQIPFAAIGFARLADRAVERIRPEAFVVRSPIVVAGDSKQAGERQNQQRGRKWNEAR